MVPSSVVLVGLVAFSVGLLTRYLKTPGMRQEGSIRPIQQGTGLAKDVGLLGTGLTLLLDDLAERRRSGLTVVQPRTTERTCLRA